MSDDATQQEIKDQFETTSLSEFLETKPPGAYYLVLELTDFDKERVLLGQNQITMPDIVLYCGNQVCDGLRVFSPSQDKTSIKGSGFYVWFSYLCRNCKNSSKTFGVICALLDGKKALLKKLGEDPPFGPPVPSRVISLIGPDRDLFLLGRQAENQGMGIGAFAYYRRVVENQKWRLIMQIGKAAKNLGADSTVIAKFEKAAKESQFHKAINDIKDVFPKTLLLKGGHNPLLLLHSALSDGLHDKGDEKCLEMATSIRVVLTELAERISEALKDEAELNNAISHLLSHNATKTNSNNNPE